ncbi:MAG TPA: hypothetical protein VLT37_10195 [Acidocella sp.]|nr:hypothetical protein [Acidocella sp.]
MRNLAGLVFCLGVVAALVGCAAAPVTPPPAAVPKPPDYSAPVAALRHHMAQEVPPETRSAPADDAAWIARTRAMLAASPYKITSPQLVLAVDRNPAVQQLRVIFANPTGPWQVVGGGKVSTGQTGRYGFFITPTGVFPHNTAILDYRAEGTYNENHIRGLGIKGRRVWDFGWEIAVEGWRTDGQTGEIRLLLHATDPDVLEPRLGRPDSKGCVRVSAAMNVFLDRHAVLDADYLRYAAEDPRIAAVLPADSNPFPYAGTYMVVFDSSEPPP